MEKHISLVLSGGGARGIAHIGVIKVLEKQGYIIDAVAGTSMGALVGALYADGSLDAYTDWLTKTDIKEIIKLIDFSIKEPGLIKGDKIMKKIQSFLIHKNIEDFEIPFTAIATNLTSSNEQVFTKGNILEAVRASISIPSVFTPVTYKKSILVDGGVVNNIPINHIQKNSNNLIIAVCANAEKELDKNDLKILQVNKSKQTEKNRLKIINLHLSKYITKAPNGRKKLSYYKILDESLHMMLSRISQNTIATYKPDILINIPRKTCGTFDFLKAEKVIQIGQKYANDALENI